MLTALLLIPFLGGLLLLLLPSSVAVIVTPSTLQR